jgi:hypothetical protein
MNDDIQKAMQRTKRYWHVDGLVEGAFGGVCLVLALFFLIQSILPQNNLFSQLLNAGFVVILIGSMLVSRKAVTFAKERLTYPRTGYVSYRRSTGGRHVLAFGVAMLMATLVTVLFVTAPTSLDWLPAITGLLIGGAMLFFSYRVGLARFALLALISSLLGCALSLVGLGNVPGLALYYGLMGLALLVSGGLTLARYLRETDMPEEITNEPGFRHTGA